MELCPAELQHQKSNEPYQNNPEHPKKTYDSYVPEVLRTCSRMRIGCLTLKPRFGLLRGPGAPHGVEPKEAVQRLTSNVRVRRNDHP